ncbi:hypothetical protein [Thiomicrorhabdus xiamenensis]|uniref:Uncharacterized protein n=1 Tax=Thiomicrorhabdus xiamenensis TaxID=2739063 RepID=A0A7D4P3K0_9GAMM|nr:hypothetical protein [Thiomicrorhabdus xiamenensis]QKI88175.1 hypothetical protein HQN79_00600 [Thiomicrorhabdus xiamenensis]
MATELLLNNPIGQMLYGDIGNFDNTDDSPRMNTALFEGVNLLNSIAGTGYTGATATDNSTNVMDFFELMRGIPMFDMAMYLNNQFMPTADVLIKLEGILNSLPIVSTHVLPMLAPERTQDEFGGDALGATIGVLKSFPTLEGPVDMVLQNLQADPLLADQVDVLTTFLHDFSFAGNLIGGTVPAGSPLSSHGENGGDTFGLVVDFASSVPVVGDVVSTIIPDVFPNAMGGDVQALAGVLHSTIPGYIVVDALIGEEGFISGLMHGEVNTDALLGLTDVLVDAAPELGGLLGGTGLISGGASADASGESSAGLNLLGALDLSSNSALNLGSLTSMLDFA